MMLAVRAGLHGDVTPEDLAGQLGTPSLNSSPSAPTNPLTSYSVLRYSMSARRFSSVRMSDQ